MAHIGINTYDLGVGSQTAKPGCAGPGLCGVSRCARRGTALRKSARGWPATSEEWLQATSRPVKAAHVDSSVPNVARVWNYLIGGRDNFEADRQAAKQLIAASPVMPQVAVASRAFLRRTVTYLAAEAGIRQFLDIGTGIPTAGNTHEIGRASCRERV